MPYEIKYDPRNGGQRKIVAIKQTTPQPSTLLNDLVESLKGLTFKFEVKITDIVKDDQSCEQPPLSPVTTEKAAAAPMPVAAQPPILVPPQVKVATIPKTIEPVASPVTLETKPNILKTISPEPTFAPKESPIFEDFRRPKLGAPLSSYDQAELKVEPLQYGVSESQKERDVVQPVTPPAQAPPSHQATTGCIIRGSIKAGSVIEACCIALDECIKPPTAYISYDESKLIKISEIMRNYENEIESLPSLTSPAVGDIVYAKATEDDTWYRAMVETSDGQTVDVSFFDWGLREKNLPKDRIRNLVHGELGLCKFPACALKIQFTEESKPLLDEVLKLESTFKMRVESFNQATESYAVTVLEKVS